LALVIVIVVAIPNCLQICLQAKELLTALQGKKEYHVLKGRIEVCEQASALANGGVLTLPLREVNLNVKKMTSGKKVLPWPLEMDLCQRRCVEIFRNMSQMDDSGDQKKPGNNPGSDIHIAVKSLAVWTAFCDDDDSSLGSFDPLNPSLACLTTALADRLVMRAGQEESQGHEQEHSGLASVTWQACISIKCDVFTFTLTPRVVKL